MILHNELVIDGVRTSSFPFKVIVQESPVLQISASKSQLLNHDGISGAIMQTNRHRDTIQKKYSISLVGATELQVYEFAALLCREKFWLENEQVKETRLWCYKVDSMEAPRDAFGVVTFEVTFICHPTKFFKESETKIFTSSGVLRLKGSALAFPRIKVNAQTGSQTSFTIGSQVIRFEMASESAIMTNNPDNPSFLSSKNQPIRWSGDFISLDANQKEKNIGIVLGPGVRSLEIETVWGWA